MARLAYSLETFKAECNKKWPERDRSSDGWIGDPAHASRTSDHNPNAVGVVRAYDLDAGSGRDTAIGLWIAEHVRRLGQSGFRSLQGGGYVISASRIASEESGWAWRAYSGSSPHIAHTHVSVGKSAIAYDYRGTWNIADNPIFVPAPQPTPVSVGLTKAKIVELQRTLNDWYRVVKPNWYPLAADGIWGPKTESAVRYFQTRARLVVDGIPGPKTLGALGIRA